MPAPPTIQRAGMLALALPDCAEVELALAAELEAEVEDAGLVAELAGAEATFATAPAAEAVELADEDLDVVDGKTVLQEIPPVPDARTTDGRAVND